MDRKKIIIAVAFFTAVIVFAWLLYFFFFRQLLIEPEPGVNGNVNGTLPVVVNGNISVIGNTNQPGLPQFPGLIDLDAPTDIARGGLTNVVDYDISNVDALSTGVNGDYFYNRDVGLFFMLEDGKPVALSNKNFYNVNRVTWSRDQNQAVLEYPDGSNVIYNFKTEKQVTLPKELTDFSFNKNGDEIAAKWIGDTIDENWLMIGDNTGEDFKLLEPLGDRAHNVHVDISPDNQYVAFVRSADSATTQKVIPIGQQNENFKSFSVDGLNFESKWSPSGNDLLYNVATAGNDYGPELWLTPGSTEQLGSSHINLRLTTWASKCTFNREGTSIYCAEPLEVPRGAGLYPEILQGVPDAFYRIDLRTGQKIPLAFPVGNQSIYSAKSVSLSSDESQLYFVDSNTGALHSIRLK